MAFKGTGKSSKDCLRELESKAEGRPTETEQPSHSITCPLTHSLKKPMKESVERRWKRTGWLEPPVRRLDARYTKA